MARPPSDNPKRHTIPLRFDDEDLVRLDRLRLPGESRSGSLRRLLARVTYAQEVALAARDMRSLPAGDPRALVAAGKVSIVFPLPPGGVGLGVVDTDSGVTLHKMRSAEETEAGYVPDPVPARASALRRLEGLIRPEAMEFVRTLDRKDAARISEVDWVEWAMAASRDFERIS